MSYSASINLLPVSFDSAFAKDALSLSSNSAIRFNTELRCALVVFDQGPVSNAKRADLIAISTSLLVASWATSTIEPSAGWMMFLVSAPEDLRRLPFMNRSIMVFYSRRNTKAQRTLLPRAGSK